MFEIDDIVKVIGSASNIYYGIAILRTKDREDRFTVDFLQYGDLEQVKKNLGPAVKYPGCYKKDNIWLSKNFKECMRQLKIWNINK